MTEPLDMTQKQLDSQRIPKESRANQTPGLPKACTEEGALFKIAKGRLKGIVIESGCNKFNNLLNKLFSPPIQNVIVNYYKCEHCKSNSLCFVSNDSLHQGSNNFLLIHLFQAYDLPGPKISSKLPNINQLDISTLFKA